MRMKGRWDTTETERVYVAQFDQVLNAISAPQLIREMLDPKSAAREEYHDLLAAALCYDAHAIRLDAESKRISRLAVQAREQAQNLKAMANL